MTILRNERNNETFSFVQTKHAGKKDFSVHRSIAQQEFYATTKIDSTPPAKSV